MCSNSARVKNLLLLGKPSGKLFGSGDKWTDMSRYKWTLLGTGNFTPEVVGNTFKALTVHLNASVVQGENLGFSIEETGAYYGRVIGNHLTPWCHLEYNVEGNDMALFEQGSGKTSFAGLYGNISAVVPRSGRAIKFFTNVV